jgi:ABC-type multidrug transport system permease subunit
MLNLFRDAYSILWADLHFLKRDWKRTLLTGLIGPVLYLVTFGLGLGKSISIEGSSYLDFIIPGIIALSCMNSSFSSAGIRLNVDRLFYKSFDELLMAPVSLYSITIGKASIGVVRGFLASLPLILLGLVLSNNFHINWEFALSLFISLVVFSLLGVIGAFLAKSHQDMSTFSTIVIVPMSFLCGTFFSISSLPQPIQWILYILPLTHSSQAIRAATTTAVMPWISVVVLMIFSIAFFIIASRMIQRLSI